MKPFISILLIFACFAIVTHVDAHAHPMAEMPAEGATVAAPSEVRIVFNDTLEPAFSSIIVSDAQGHAVTSVKADVDPSSHKALHLSLPMLTPGMYQVKWVAVSVDGHRTNGTYRFAVK